MRCGQLFDKFPAALILSHDRATSGGRHHNQGVPSEVDMGRNQGPALLGLSREVGVSRRTSDSRSGAKGAHNFAPECALGPRVWKTLGATGAECSGGAGFEGPASPAPQSRLPRRRRRRHRTCEPWSPSMAAGWTWRLMQTSGGLGATKMAAPALSKPSLHRRCQAWRPATPVACRRVVAWAQPRRPPCNLVRPYDRPGGLGATDTAASARPMLLWMQASKPRLGAALAPDAPAWAPHT